MTMQEYDVIAAARKVASTLASPDELSFVEYMDNEGIKMPTESIDFPTDYKTLLALNEVEQQIEQAQMGMKIQAETDFMNASREYEQDGTSSIGDVAPNLNDYIPPPSDDLLALIARAAELRSQIDGAKIKFNLVGIRPDRQDELPDEARLHAVKQLPQEITDAGPDSVTLWIDERARVLFGDMSLADNIESIEYPDTVPPRKLTKPSPPVCHMIISRLMEDQRESLFKVMRKVNTAALFMDEEVDAGFPGGHDQQAAEQPVRAAAAERTTLE